ncbi:butyrophilin subfamily 3 member A3-like isoform X2 [Phalacrocorax carbo]|uniref:butyrophilin subfamily 3 member A3-like isoform X2 n=1 Tax=Phalacrocorax carbo TaxID=9209 RepID=UPI003119B178
MSWGRRWGRTSAVLGTGNCTDASQCLGAGCSFVQSPPSPVFVQKPLGFGWRLAFCTAGEGSCVSGSQLRPPCAGPGRGRKRTRLLLSVSGPLWGCAVVSPFPAPRRGAGAQHRSPPPPGAMAACTPAGRAVKADGKVLVSSRPCLPRVTSALACAVIFSCAFLVPELEGAQFRVLGPDQPVTAVVGEDVVLPCRLSPRLNAENMDVLWFWSKSRIFVHIYSNGQDDYSSQMPQYRGRTELSKEGLSVGNVSLRILSTRLSDEGQYRCRVQDGDFDEEASVELQVADSIFPKEYPWKVAFFVTLAACFASLVAFPLFISRLRAQSRELGKRDAEIRWRNAFVPVEEVHVTLDADTAHPLLILSDGGKSVRRGNMQQEVPDNPERYSYYHCVLGQEGFTSGRYFWDVDVGKEEGGEWSLGVAKESTERKGKIDLDPRNGIWGIGHWSGKYRTQRSPNQKILSLTRRPQRIRVYLDTEAQKVAFFYADNQDLLYTFPLGPLSGERIRPWFWVYVSAQLTLKSPPSPPPVPSEEEPLLPSCIPLPTLPTGRRAPRTPTAGHDQDGEIHAAVHEQP